MIHIKQNRPKCGCGNTQDPNGYCDGSHLNN
jgi:CDGSH-type Zn-finger protein